MKFEKTTLTLEEQVEQMPLTIENIRDILKYEYDAAYIVLALKDQFEDFTDSSLINQILSDSDIQDYIQNWEENELDSSVLKYVKSVGNHSELLN